MNTKPGLSRRSILKTGLLWSALAVLGLSSAKAKTSASITLPFARGRRPLIAFPQKRPLMVMTTRPPQLETPFHIFNENILTPNDAFFVRWHLANVPTHVDLNEFRLTIRGEVGYALSLSLDDLKRNFESINITAVCQCGGNSRGFFNPRVPGGQWGHGAMGNAKWTGVRLQDLLKKAELRDHAVQVKFNGLDQAVANATPDFRKSLNLEDVLRKEVIVAYAMNDEPLPYLNGYPLRLVVPGWYASYWIKSLNDIEILNAVDEEFWMKHAYRLPADPCACVGPGQKPLNTVPISTMTVRSFITNIQNGDTLKGGKPSLLKGIAFDRGYGIDQVLVSTNGGKQWKPAQLGDDYGDFSFRPWETSFTPQAGRSYQLQCLAINRIGETQRWNPRWNPSGYGRNVIETVSVTAM